MMWICARALKIAQGRALVGHQTQDSRGVSYVHSDDSRVGVRPLVSHISLLHRVLGAHSLSGATD